VVDLLILAFALVFVAGLLIGRASKMGDDE
jgi:hypothetical protein